MSSPSVRSVVAVLGRSGPATPSHRAAEGWPGSASGPWGLLQVPRRVRQVPHVPADGRPWQPGQQDGVAGVVIRPPGLRPRRWGALPPRAPRPCPLRSVGRRRPRAEHHVDENVEPPLAYAAEEVEVLEAEVPLRCRVGHDARVEHRTRANKVAPQLATSTETSSFGASWILGTTFTVSAPRPTKRRPLCGPRCRPVTWDTRLWASTRSSRWDHPRGVGRENSPTSSSHR